MWCRSSVTACSPDRDRLPCDGGLRESAGRLREGGNPGGRGRDRVIGYGLWHRRVLSQGSIAGGPRPDPGGTTMTTTPAAPAPQAGSARTLHLSELLRRPLERDGESIGRLSDVIVRLRGADYPVVTGVVATVGGREVYVPIDKAGSFDGEAVKLTSAKLDLRSFQRREGGVLLPADVLGPRLLDVGAP